MLYFNAPLDNVRGLQRDDGVGQRAVCPTAGAPLATAPPFFLLSRLSLQRTPSQKAAVTTHAHALLRRD